MPESSRTRSSTRIAIVVAILVIVLAVGGYAIYKLTRSSDSNEPASVVAKRAFAALEAGDNEQLRELSTAEGYTQLEGIDRNQLDGLQFSPPCPFVAPEPPTRACTWTRPGGQLTMQLTADGHTWLVDAASLGPAGLPPDTSGGATSTPSS